jgi:hypothetical protein
VSAADPIAFAAEVTVFAREVGTSAPVGEPFELEVGTPAPASGSFALTHASVNSLLGKLVRQVGQLAAGMASSAVRGASSALEVTSFMRR